MARCSSCGAKRSDDELSVCFTCRKKFCGFKQSNCRAICDCDLVLAKVKWIYDAEHQVLVQTED